MVTHGAEPRQRLGQDPAQLLGSTARRGDLSTPLYELGTSFLQQDLSEGQLAHTLVLKVNGWTYSIKEIDTGRTEEEAAGEEHDYKVGFTEYQRDSSDKR